MPTASPIINASEGVEVFTSANAATASTPDHRDADAEDGRDDRHPCREQRAERDGQDEQRDQHADGLGRTDVDRGLGERLATEVHIEVGVAGWLRGLLQVVDGRRLEPVEGHVELHLGQGVATVVADRELRAGSFANGSVATSTWSTFFTLSSTAPTWSSYDVIRSPSGATKRIWPGRAGQLGEALLEGVQALLRLGAGDGHVVLQLATEPHGQGAEADEHDCPEREHRLRPAGDGVAEAVEV